jgi:Putative adhesin
MRLEEKTMHTFTSTKPITASLNLIMGNVFIIAGDGDEVRVSVNPTHPSKASDVRSAEQTRVEFADDRLTIVQPRSLSHYSWFGSGNSIEVVVELPRESRILASVSYGPIRVEGMIGPSTIKTSYGDLTVEDGQDLNLHTGYGGITVNRASGHTEISGGKAHVAEIDGTATIKSSQNGTFVGIVTGPIQVTSSYGDIEVDHAFAPVVAKTAYGKVRINDAVRGTIDMRSSYGELELGIRNGTAAWLDLDANHGTVRNALPAASAPDEVDGSGDPVDTVEVLGRTSWGDIIVRRAVASRR